MGLLPAQRLLLRFVSENSLKLNITFLYGELTQRVSDQKRKSQYRQTQHYDCHKGIFRQHVYIASMRRRDYHPNCSGLEWQPQGVLTPKSWTVKHEAYRSDSDIQLESDLLISG